MKNKKIYIVAIIILLSVFLVLYSPIKNSFIKVDSKTDSTYSIGDTQRFYKIGKGSVITNTKTFHTKTKIASLGKDSTYIFTKKDSLYNFTIKIIPAADTNSFLLDYFLDIKSKNLVRVDTIYQIRVDTLKIKQVITKVLKPPFYNTFWFGAAAATAVILLLIHFI